MPVSYTHLDVYKRQVIKLSELFAGTHPILEQAYAPSTVRFFILQSQYRSTLDFSNEALQASEKALRRLMEDVYKRQFAWTGNSIFTKRKAENHFRIVNWNIQSFNGLSKNVLAKKMVRNEVATSILKTYPDIICLQEFNNAAAENNISLFSRTHPYHYFSKDYQRNDGTYQAGCIIFSKYPMICLLYTSRCV